MEKLLSRCRSNDPAAWDEFFRRFTGVIQRSIVHRFIGKNLYNMANDPDIIDSVFCELVEKFLLHDILPPPEQILNFKAWLRTIVKNYTSDWMAAYFRQKHMPDRLAEQTMVSMDAPLGEDGKNTLHGILKDHKPMNTASEKQSQPPLGEIMEELTDQELWVLKLKIIFYDPLNDEEIASLAAHCNRSQKEVRSLVGALMDRLVVKEFEKEKDILGAGRIWAVLQHLEGRLINRAYNEMNRSKEELEEIKTDIERRRKRMQVLLQSASRFIEPTNKDIAFLLNIPVEKSKQVSVILFRLRQKLADSIEEEMK